MAAYTDPGARRQNIYKTLRHHVLYKYETIFNLIIYLLNELSDTWPLDLPVSRLLVHDQDEHLL